MPRLAPDVRQQRRQALIDAAWACAAITRFSDLTVDDVCAAAGVSKGLFYHYFASKQELLFALLDESVAALDRVLAELDGADLSGVERLRRFTRAMLELDADPGRAQIRADLWADLLADAEVRARVSATIQHRRACMRRWIEQSVAVGELHAIPTNAMASIVLALGDGLMLHASLDSAAFQWVNIRRALDVLFDGLSRPATTAPE